MPDLEAQIDCGGAEFELLWEDAERRIYRRISRRISGQIDRRYPDRHDQTPPSAILLVEAADRSGPNLLAQRMRHEVLHKDRLDGDWAVLPLAFVEARSSLLLHDPGGNVLSRVAGPALPIERFLAMALAVARSVYSMHRAGWLHRDIRPSNVIFDEVTGVARLAGFGIAVPPGGDAPDERRPDSTLAYMAPERTGRVDGPVDQRSDLYSVGVTLYELLTGALPLTASDPAEWMHSHLARKPVPPAYRRPDAPRPLCEIVMKLLCKAADDRYQTAASLVSDLSRCLDEWQAGRRIRPFRPGTDDAPVRIRFRDTLYGRDREMAELRSAYADVASNGQPRVVLVAGYSGIGKSALIDSLRKALAGSKATFATGKFDQYKHAEPYTAIAQAFQPLVRDLLGMEDDDVAAWRTALQSALKCHAQLIVDLIPELKHLIGPQPDVCELSGAEARGRFLRVFRDFAGVFARRGHPLVLFLDDLQWLDTATLDVFRALASHPGVPNLMLIGAYRSNEVEDRPALAALVRTLQSSPQPPVRIALTGIARSQVTQMLADAVKSHPAAVAGLAASIMEKTGDNPFFITQFVAALEDDGLLVHDRRSGGWGWDLDRIRRRAITDNIVVLMIERLQRLSAVSLDAVIALACMGNRSPVQKLAIVLERDETAVRQCLNEAITLGLVLQSSSEYAFSHDRVHEAAYALLPEGDKARRHVRIGMLLLQNTPHGELDDQVFEIVSHLNRGGIGGIPPANRTRVAELNLRAGRKARASTAYAAACDYLRTGSALLQDGVDADNHGLAYELALEYAECRFLAGGVTEAKVLAESLLGLAHTELEVASAYRLKIELHMVSSENDLAVRTAITALRRLGISLQARPSARDVRSALQSAWQRFDALSPRSIADLPVMVDPLRLIAMRVLADTWPAASFTDFNAAIVVVCNMVELSLAHGSTKASNQGFALFGLLMGPALGRYREGYRLALQACEMAAGAVSRETSRTFNTMAMTAAWTQPLEKSVEWSRLAYQKGVEAGDIYFACFSGFHSVMHQLMQGRNLADDAQACGAYLGFAQETGFKDGIALLQTLERTIACLRGRTRDLTDFGDDDFDAAAFEADVTGPRLNVVSQLYWTRMTMLHYLAGQYEAALQAAQRFGEGPRGQIHLVRHLDYHFYTALAAAAAMHTAAGDRRPRLRAQVEEHYITIRRWAAGSQSRTFTDRYLLLAAEVARVDGRLSEAGPLYERSIRAARKNGSRQGEALASELAARFYLDRDLDRMAHVYLHDAVEAYWQWGAHAKVRQLRQQYPVLRGMMLDDAQTALALVPLQQFSYRGDPGHGGTSASNKFGLDQLLTTVMRAVLQCTQAQYGALLRVHHAAGAECVASARVSGDTVAVTLGDEDGPGHLSEPLLGELLGAGGIVVIDDASGDERFAHKPHGVANPLRSLLCLPITGAGGRTTVLYLERNDVPRAFRTMRLDIPEILATHAAAAIDNARLYTELEKREAHLRQLVESDAIGIQFWDLNGNVTFANDALLRMIGYDRDDVARGSVSWRRMTPPEWRSEMTDKLRELRETGAMQPWEKEYVRKDGTPIPILIGAAMFASSQGGVAFVLDLSDLKAAERRALETERRNRELHVALAHANRVATVGQLSEWIAHDVRQPLTDIVVCGMAARHALSAASPDLMSARGALQRIVSQGLGVGDVLDHTRELVRKVAPVSEAVEINEVVTLTLSLIEPEALRKGIDIEILLGHGDMRPIADRVQLQQVVLNLLVNAIEAMSGQTAHPRQLTVVTDDGFAEGYLIEIRDTGPGFPSTGTINYFDAFATTKAGALGMGLSICQSIMEGFGGRLWASPNAPRGTILRVVLPRPVVRPDPAHDGGATLAGA